MEIYAAVEKVPTLGSKLLSPNGFFVGIGFLANYPEEIFKLRSGLAVRVDMMHSPKPCLNNILVGTIYPQNLPSVLVGHELLVDDLESDSCILDMCAAPGGI